MSIFASWFGFVKAADPTPPPPSSTIDQSLDTIDDLVAKKMQHMQKARNAEKLARECKHSGDPKRAISYMKQKQIHDQQAKAYDGMISNMEKTSLALDSVATATQVASTMKEATTQMKYQLKKVDVGSIETIADDLDESIRDAKDLSDALSRPMGGGGEVEDDEILAEMDSWSEVQLGTPVPATVPPVPPIPQDSLNMPDVPKTKIKVTE